MVSALDRCNGQPLFCMGGCLLFGPAFCEVACLLPLIGCQDDELLDCLLTGRHARLVVAPQLAVLPYSLEVWALDLLHPVGNME